MGSRVTRVIGFLPVIFSLLRPSDLDLGQVRDRQTDDGHQCIFLHLRWQRHN